MSAPREPHDAAGAVDPGRLRDLALALVRIRSHPGEETGIAEAYAQALSDAGARVRLDREFDRSPAVIARIGGDGPCLQLAGHLDTVPVEHDPPTIVGDVLSGRGACDMKAGLAAIVETVRALAPAIGELGGALLVTAYGLHEGPGRASMHAPLRGLIRRGCRGDAAIVCEGPRGMIPVCGKGALIFRIVVSRPGGGADHELHAGDVPNPIAAACRLSELVAAEVARSSLRHARLGGETFFIGAFNAGELYNTTARRATLEGTRRYPPPRSFDEAVAGLRHACATVEAEFGVSVALSCERSGQPFELAPDAAVISAVRTAHRDVTGTELPTGAQLFSSDLNQFAADAGIPAAAYGVDPSSGHSANEHVSLAELETVARVLVAAGGHYLGMR